MKNRKVEIGVIAAILVLQSVLYIFFGFNKSYLHMDEAYSLGLSQYDKTEIQDNPDFYNTWHDGKYYEDYLVLDEDEFWTFSSVYENQKNDVHPPFYYLLLRLSMRLTAGGFSYWCGIGLNIVIHLFITILTYFILQRLLWNIPHSKELSAIIAFASALTLASISSMLYIRMYSLVSLLVLITAILHLKLAENRGLKTSLFVGASVTAFLGSLTHYYYLFFLFVIFIILSAEYIRRRDYKSLFVYFASVGLSGICSLGVFPHSLHHLFGGYRGQGALENLFSLKGSFKIWSYLNIIDSFAFNRLLLLVIALTIPLMIYKKDKVVKYSIWRTTTKNFLFVCVPAVGYFVITAVSSPYNELRYILPVCGIFFIAVMSALVRLFNDFFGAKKGNLILVCLSALLLLSPIVTGMDPEFVYVQRKNIAQAVEEKSDIPALYTFNSHENRFLDDILLFSKLENSYVAKDADINEEWVREVFEDRDISKGIFLFINEGNDNDSILQTVQSALGFEEIQYVDHLNACDVYLLK